MMMDRFIFLIGMPGCGKSYWGARWAKGQGCPFVDLDEEIETAAAITIPAIFQDYGEALFREKERVTLQQVISSRPSPSIIATGGGTPVFFDNLQVMKSAGCVVYLTAAVDYLADRIGRESVVRPLLSSGDLKQQLATMLAKREAIYEQAHLIFPAERLSDATFAEILTACTNRHSWQASSPPPLP